MERSTCDSAAKCTMVSIFLSHQLIDELGIANIAVYEAEVRVGLHGLKIGEIPRIREHVQHHHPVVWIVLKPIMSEVRTDKTSTTSD